MATGIGLNDLGKIFASIRTSVPLIGRPVGSFTTPSRVGVPAHALKAKTNNPIKPIPSDLRNMMMIDADFH